MASSIRERAQRLYWLSLFAAIQHAALQESDSELKIDKYFLSVCRLGNRDWRLILLRRILDMRLRFAAELTTEDSADVHSATRR